MANISQVITIDKRALTERFSSLGPEIMQSVDDGLRLSAVCEAARYTRARRLRPTYSPLGNSQISGTPPNIAKAAMSMAVESPKASPAAP